MRRLLVFTTVIIVISGCKSVGLSTASNNSIPPLAAATITQITHKPISSQTSIPTPTAKLDQTNTPTIVIQSPKVQEEHSKDFLYENKKLGFSLVIPASWQGKYQIKESSGTIEINFIVNSTITKYLYGIRAITREDWITYGDSGFYSLLEERNGYVFMGNHPTEAPYDIQYDKTNFDLWIKMENQMADVLKTFKIFSDYDQLFFNEIKTEYPIKKLNQIKYTDVDLEKIKNEVVNFAFNGTKKGMTITLNKNNHPVVCSNPTNGAEGLCYVILPNGNMTEEVSGDYEGNYERKSKVNFEGMVSELIEQKILKNVIKDKVGLVRDEISTTILSGEKIIFDLEKDEIIDGTMNKMNVIDSIEHFCNMNKCYDPFTKYDNKELLDMMNKKTFVDEDKTNEFMIDKRDFEPSVLTFTTIYRSRFVDVFARIDRIEGHIIYFHLSDIFPYGLDLLDNKIEGESKGNGMLTLNEDFTKVSLKWKGEHSVSIDSRGLFVQFPNEYHSE